MSCRLVHDFINGTTIVPPRPMIGQSDDNEVWDILRPNQKATTLVGQHVEALAALNKGRNAKPRIQLSPL